MDNRDVLLQVGENQWSGISDAQLRKRIQNRLAQRRHRRKIRELGTQEFAVESPSQVFGDLMQPVEPSFSAAPMIDQQLAGQSHHSYTQICTPLSASGVSSSTSLPDAPYLQPPGNMCLGGSEMAASTLPYIELELSSGNDMGIVSPSALDSVVFPIHDGKQNNPENIGRNATGIYNQSVDSGLPDDFRRPRWPQHGEIRCAQADQSNRFHSVLVILKSLGFATVDDMVTQYYTVQFPEGSRAAQAQRLSRQRHLRRFLAELHSASVTWHQKDRTNYRDQILCAAEEFYQRDLHDLVGKLQSISGQDAYTELLGEFSADGAPREASLSHSRLGAMQQLKGLLEDQFPDLLSLFTVIATAVDLHSPQTCLDDFIRTITKRGTS